MERFQPKNLTPPNPIQPLGLSVFHAQNSGYHFWRRLLGIRDVRMLAGTFPFGGGCDCPLRRREFVETHARNSRHFLESRNAFSDRGLGRDFVVPCFQEAHKIKSDRNGTCLPIQRQGGTTPSQSPAVFFLAHQIIQKFKNSRKKRQFFVTASNMFGYYMYDTFIAQAEIVVTEYCIVLSTSKREPRL